MDQSSHRHLKDFFPFWRRLSLCSKRNHEENDQPARHKDVLGQSQEFNVNSLTSCADFRERDPHLPYQNNDGDWGKCAVTTAGLSTLTSVQGSSGRQPAIDHKSVPLGSTPKRSKSLHGLLKPGSKNDKEPSQKLWKSSPDKTLEERPVTQPAPVRWLQRCMSTTLGRRHQSRNTSTPVPKTPLLHARPEMLSIPGIGIEPPQVPDSTTSGAAARAAAAAQNQMLKSAQNIRLTELKVTRDSESGIGIEVRDGGVENTETTVPVIRRDPASILPEELVSQILSYLDATSLINAELVSQRWQRSAGSNRIWKHVFRREFEHTRSIHQVQPAFFQVGGQGLGRNIGDQSWKKMWRAREALHQRWVDGHAAAIYLEGHADCVYCVQFDEHKILTGSRDRTIRIWDAHTYECIKVLGVPNGQRPPVAPLPTNVTGHGQRPFDQVFPPLRMLEHDSKSASEYHHGSVLCLQYDDEIIATGSSDSTLIIWDIRHDYQPIRRLRHHTAGVLDVCFDAKHIVSCSKDTTVCLWDRRTGVLLRTLSGHRGPVNAVQLRGNLVVSASGDGVAKLWNLNSGLCIKEFPSKDRGMACVEFSPDSGTILAGGNDQVVYQFDTNTGELVRELKGHKNLVRSLHLDNINGRIISGSYDTSVRAYDLHTGDTIIDFTLWTTSWILSAKADYRRIIATSQDSRVVIMDFGYQLPGVELLEG